jgi:hypothetical protein
MTERITGQVARILTSRDLVINRGRTDGVTEGMKFAVLDPAGENIKDPESGESLGSIRRPKVYVQVSKVEERLALARTYRFTQVNLGGQASGSLALTRLFMPPKWVTKYETFKTDESTWETLTEEESIVKTGDPVEQILSELEELNGEQSQEAP